MNIFYLIVKLWVRFTLHLFCKRITWHGTEILQHSKPLLIGANHPNSFFDAMLIGAYMKLPVHFMTRSDVFKLGWVRFLLRQLHMIPVYRIRDGKDKIGLNDNSFNMGCNYLKKGDHVLIFVEGFCDYQTTLQPLKKGGARMLHQSWTNNVEVAMLPLWIRYNSFSDFPKSIDLIPGIPFEKKEMPVDLNQPAALQWINTRITEQLENLSTIRSPQDRLKGNVFLFPFAMIGFVLHFVYFQFFKYLVTYLNKGDIHYDSMLYAGMAAFYPLWLMLLWSIGTFFLSSAAALSLPLLAIICARTYVLWK